ncbi:hypothetical protein JM16_001843 [Phytophthora kernoviae]|uniref:non-specific serine/threonine protein kinase n=1 Tax=Phytophthora kernoviae TaxID=325452 RepID=A0A8T0M547_9STRA|nr:hypothetical protein JM16_001843 [Phytophthora kernoviae]
MDEELARRLQNEEDLRVIGAADWQLVDPDDASLQMSSDSQSDDEFEDKEPAPADEREDYYDDDYDEAYDLHLKPRGLARDFHLDGATEYAGKEFNSLRESMRRQDKFESHRTPPHIDLGKNGGGMRERMFDERTQIILHKLMNKGLVTAVKTRVHSGREANVYHGTGLDTVAGRERALALKIFKINNGDYSKFSECDESGRRYDVHFIKKLIRRQLKTWAEREYKYMSRAAAALAPKTVTETEAKLVSAGRGARVPKPLVLREHILIAEFVGTDGHPAASLEDAALTNSQLRSAYTDLLRAIRRLYQHARLVFGQLSTTNILYHDDQCWLMDLGLAVEVNSENQDALLTSDLDSIDTFFRSRGVPVVSTRYVGLLDIATAKDPEFTSPQSSALCLATMPSYTVIKTPEVDAGSPSFQTQPSTVSPSTTVHVVRFFIVLGIAIFIFGNIAAFAPMYELELVHTFMRWWNGYPGMPDTTSGEMNYNLDMGPYRNITESGHTEMVRPTFLFIFCIVPFAISVLLIEYLRHINTTRRLTSNLIWRFAMLMRRKPKFPVLGVSRFTWGEWVFGVFYVLGGNILCFWYGWDHRVDTAKETDTLDTSMYYSIIGINCAYLCIYNMAFLLLPVTRNSGWMEFFNVSYANGVKFHRWIGFMTVITGVIHMLGYWIYWIRIGQWQVNQLPCTSCDFTQDFSGGGFYAWFNVFGFISVAALVLIIPTSIPIIRRKAYEWFYITHWVLFVIAVLFAILHWAQIIWWILPSGCVWFVSRAASSWNAMTPVSVREFSIIGEGEDELVKVIVKRAAPGSSPASSAYDYKVGNFLYLNVPQISKLEWHALTIASSPKTSPTDVTLLIKPLGDWSKNLVQYAKDCNRDNVAPLMYMDGFYGASLELYEDYPTVCLVGGGIGVTPVLAILDDLVAKLSSNGAAWTQRFSFIFTFRELSVFESVAPVVARLRELDPHEQFFQAHLFATGTYSEVNLGKKLEISPVKEVGDAAPAKATSRAARPFYEPLRSSNTLRFVMYLALYVIAVFVVAAVRWGNGLIQGDNHFELWPLERAFELFMFCATIVVVYAFVWYEYAVFRRSHGANTSAPTPVDIATPQSNVAVFGGDVHTVGDLLNHMSVVVGERPNMHSLLQQILEVHKTVVESVSLLPAVGVVVSGPSTLKMVTNEAVVALGGGNFDVHEEEFEL